MKQSILFLLVMGISMIFVSCAKDPVPADDSDLYANQYYFKAEIDGYEKKHIRTRNAYATISDGDCFDELVVDTVVAYQRYWNYRTGFYQQPEGFTVSCREQLYIAYRNIPLHYYMNEDSLFHATFATGERGYFQNTNSVDSTASKGIEIIWVDKLGKVWSTKWDTQEGSFFNIKEDRSYIGGMGEIKHEIRAEFDCIFYDKDKNSLLCEFGEVFIDFTMSCR